MENVKSDFEISVLKCSLSKEGLKFLKGTCKEERKFRSFWIIKDKEALYSSINWCLAFIWPLDWMNISYRLKTGKTKQEIFQ